ncbi:hypothetical protein ALUC_60083S [Aspergillus luchuensis]|nr:hypothetical protein ALUC_60083S [Aspergillus luchuensis]
MTSLQSANWLSDFDLFHQEADRVAPNPVHPGEPFFVDVGGGHGHQCIQLRDKYPYLRGRLVLQDLPEAVDHLPPLDGIQVMAHDIFQPQTMKSEQILYLYINHHLTRNRFSRSKVLLPATDPSRLPGFSMRPYPSTPGHCHGA